MPNTEITDDYIKNAILSTTSTGAYLIKIIQDNNVCAILQGHNVSENYRFYVAFSYYNIGYVNKIKTYKLRLEEWTIETYTTNTDLTARFNPIEINGTKGDTFKNVLKNKCNNSVNFIVFNGSTENPISDNPFTSKNGYCIAFNSDRLNAYNYFILLGITKDIIETKIFDTRS